MILSFQVDDGYGMIDNISNIYHRPASDGEMDGAVPAKIMVRFTRDNGETIEMNFSRPVYLLNDNGKTIDRLLR